MARLRTWTWNATASIASAIAALVVTVIVVGCCGLSRHQDLLVAPADSPAAGDAQVKVTYLGCNGFFIENGETRLLIDPCFSRPGFGRVLLGMPIPPDQERIDAGLREIGMPEAVDAILVTHAHYDHLLDVPPLQRRTGATLIASPTGCELALRAGIAGTELDPVLPGVTRRAGGATIEILESSHDTFCGFLFFPGGTDLSEAGQRPTRPADYVCGTPLAFLITIGGKTIYADCGGTTAVLPPDRPDGTDLAILGVALQDGRDRFVPAIRRLRPRIVFPSHQENFFRSLDQPYQFSLASDMGDVRQQFEASGAPGKLVLLDFFDALLLE